MKIWKRWVRIISYREKGTVLAFLRMAAGLCVILSILPTLLSGTIDVIWVDLEFGGYRTLNPTSPFAKWLGGATPTTAWFLACTAVTGATFLVIGLGGRISALLTGQAFLALTSINHHAAGSYDLILSNLLWIVFLSRSTATCSVDCRLRSGSWRSDQLVPAWPRYLAVLQLVTVYASTGIQKLSAYWTPTGEFSALYYILQQPTWQRFDMRWVAHVYPLTQWSTAMVWVWEITSPLLLLVIYYRITADREGKLRRLANRWDLRYPFITVGVAMHLLTFALMRVGPFTWVTLAYYVCLFGPNEWGNRKARNAT